MLFVSFFREAQLCLMKTIPGTESWQTIQQIYIFIRFDFSYVLPYFFYLFSIHIILQYTHEFYSYLFAMLQYLFDVFYS